MSKYYESDPIELQLNTGLNLDAATNFYIKYAINNIENGTKVIGTQYNTTYVDATVPGSAVTPGILYYQPFVSWDNGTTYYHGDIESVTINSKIEVSE